ncbi:hypothetical protein IFM89_005281 [Coptis chinensis]|uniref:C2 domain-containing protein n=1 Tax=Coptis chinensis TaxID=261450 RepID=A0A835IUR6_9MAGN|nr:hypothetical protein IFM89_005281 [Coptis chinensis]
MGASQNLSPLICELKVIRAKNLEFVSTGNLFLRYHLLTGNDKRIRLKIQEVPSTCDLYWNESTTLECLGAEDTMNKLKQQSVVFELRWRKPSTMFGKFGVGSKLLFRTEIAWKDVLNSTNLSIEKWITSAKTSKFVPEGLKPPALQISMNIQDPRTLKIPKRSHAVRSINGNVCGCKNGECNGRDDDIFALAAALDVL